MQLFTERLILTEISSQDLEKIHQLHSIPEVDEFNTLGIPKDLEETRQIIQRDIDDQNKSPRSRYCWKIILKETNEFIGLAGMFPSNDRFKMAEFYYKLFPDFWGNGYATETAKRIIRFGFEELKLHRIEAGVATKNVASIRVLEKAGMSNEGITKENSSHQGQMERQLSVFYS